MDRRRVYAFIRQLAAEHTRRAILAAFVAAMRRVRDLPAGVDALAGRLSDLSELRPVLLADDCLARVYQAVNAPALEAAYRGTTRDRRRFTAEEIPAVTQLFTPPWVVDFLLHNTLAKQWLQWHPGSSLAAELNWLTGKIPPPAARRPRTAREIRLLDPACGTGNFLVAAVGLLSRMYLEELERAGRPGWPDEPSVRGPAEIPAAIVRHNLHAMDIDPIALQLAGESLAIKLRTPPNEREANLRLGDALLDPSPGGFAAGFDVIATNPPYLSARNMPAETAARLKRRYPAAGRDAYACFILRSLEFLRQGGRAGLLTMQSFMFTGSFEKLRRHVASASSLETLAHFGPALFDLGNPGTLQTAAFTLRRRDEEGGTDPPVVAVRLTDLPNADAKCAALLDAVASRDAKRVYRLAARDLTSLPRYSWSYWTPREIRGLFATLPRLKSLARPRQGLATTDNLRFVRYWWEVQAHAAGGKWFPYVKSGQFRRWHQSPPHRVNWADDGAEIKAAIVDRYPYLDGQWEWVAKNTSHYFRPGVTYSYLTSGRFSARLLPAGCIFDVAGSSLFPEDPLAILGVLNSSIARRLLDVINPTVNHQVGDLAELPVPPDGSAELRGCVRRAVDAQCRLDAYDEATPDFRQPLPWRQGREIYEAITAELTRLEREIDQIVAGLYAVPGPRAGDPADDVARAAFSPADLARRWVSCAIAGLLSENDVLQIYPPTPSFLRRLSEILSSLTGEDSVAAEILSSFPDLSGFLARQFYAWHTRIYRRRPPLWAFVSADGQRVLLVHHAQATRAAMSKAFDRLSLDLPAGWQRHPDDPISLNLAPLHGCVADPALRRALGPIAADLAAGRYAWSATARALGRPPAVVTSTSR